MFNLLKKSTSLLKIQKRLFGSKIFKLPSIAESVEEVTIVNFIKKEGDFVNQDDEIIEVESSKGNMNVRIPQSGKILKFLVEVDDDVEIGKEYVEIDPDAEKTSKDSQSEQKEKKEESNENKEKKEESNETKEKQQEQEQKQVETKKESQKPEQQAEKQQDFNSNQKKQDFSGERKETREKMSRLRKTVAQRLKESQNTYAQVTTFQIVDMGEIMKLRKELGEKFLKEKKHKLGIMSFFIKACAQAIKERPIVNSVISEDLTQIIHRNYVDISVAVSSPKGLVVPVLRNVEKMSFLDIENAMTSLGQKAKEGKLELEEMSGGTFTISNGGVFGSFLSAPIINPPQSAILGMHNIIDTPVARNGQVVIRPIMHVSLSYDHRLLDGREGAGFLKRVSDLLTDPRLLLIEL